MFCASNVIEVGKQNVNSVLWEPMKRKLLLQSTACSADSKLKQGISLVADNVKNLRFAVIVDLHNSEEYYDIYSS